jgi:hypothetical protein
MKRGPRLSFAEWPRTFVVDDLSQALNCRSQGGSVHAVDLDHLQAVLDDRRRPLDDDARS